MTYCRLSDDTSAGTVDFIWHSNANRKYMLARDGWTPTLSRLRGGALGGDGSYERVVQEIPVNVVGESERDCLANVSKIAELLDQARRFWRGEKVSPVKFYWSPSGGKYLYQALVIGREPGDQTQDIDLQPTFNRTVNAYMAEAVKVRFRQRGLWIGTLGTGLVGQDEDAIAPSSARSPSKFVASWASTSVWPSPISLQISAYEIESSGYLLVANSTDKIELIEAEGMTASGTSQADAAADASGGSVRRYTASTVAASNSKSLSANFAANVRIVDAFATVRNNAATVTWQIRAGLQQGTLYESYADWVEVDGTNLNPQTIYLGRIAVNNDPIYSASLSAFLLQIQANVTDVTKTFDIDAIALIDAQDASSHTLALSSSAYGTGNAPLLIQPHPLDAPTPTAYMFIGASNVPVTYSGDAYLELIGNSVCVLILAVAHTSGGVYAWRAPNNNSLVFRRSRAFLLPT